VNDEHADVLGMICPTCFGQFDFGQMKISKMFDEEFNTPPVYYFQLLAFAQGIPYEKLGFDKQRFKPECLKKWQEEKAPV
jgi:heterodisulfide reductase subunit B